MTKRIMVGFIAATLLFALPQMAMAKKAKTSACTSTFQRITTMLKKHGPAIAKGLCAFGAKVFDGGDADKARKCEDAIKRASAKIKDIHKKYSKVIAKTSPFTIGPRGMPSKRWWKGKLVTERLFIGAPIAKKNARIRFQRTGGKQTAKYEVRICFVNPDSKRDATSVAKKSFRGKDKRRQKIDKHWKDVAFLMPMVWLRMVEPPKPFKTMHYKVRLDEYGGPPSAPAVAGGGGSKPAAKPLSKKRNCMSQCNASLANGASLRVQIKCLTSCSRRKKK